MPISCFRKNFVQASILCWFFFTTVTTRISLPHHDGLSFRMIHKFSGESRSVMQRRNGYDRPEWWAQKGTPDYYKQLLKHDYARHSAGRSLLNQNSTDESISFKPTNETYNLAALGGLHYSWISIGTPSTKFLVALDTGSDLFWVPCECQECAPTSAPSYGLNIELFVYKPTESNTSKQVSCKDSLCSSSLSTTDCQSSSQQCHYVVNYNSANTSTSGTLVEDIVYFNSEQTGQSVNTSIVFGCGEEQTGIFEQGVAPDGLLGLGFDSVSVPSTLARSGLVPDSFSMCFSDSDSYGRLVFGDKGTEGQSNTPFQSQNQLSLYWLNIQEIIVQGKSLAISGTFLFDTGTAITRLTSSAYQTITTEYAQLVKLPRINTSDFEYCWEVSSSSNLPSLVIAFSGGSNLTVQDPYALLVNQMGNVVGACLAILESSTAIIGHNFMGGYRFIFDREAMTLGWTESSCYDLNGVGDGGPESSPTLGSATRSSSGVGRSSTDQSSSALTSRGEAHVWAVLIAFIVSMWVYTM